MFVPAPYPMREGDDRDLCRRQKKLWKLYDECIYKMWNQLDQRLYGNGVQILEQCLCGNALKYKKMINLWLM